MVEVNSCQLNLFVKKIRIAYLKQSGVTETTFKVTEGYTEPPKRLHN